MNRTDKQETLVLLARGAPIGSCVHFPEQGGWRFITNIPGRKGGRTYHQRANACIPRWAFNRSDELVTASEWAERKAERNRR